MSSLIMIETNGASGAGTNTPEEYRVWASRLVEERGTDAAAVAVDETGRLLTPPGFSDGCVDAAFGRFIAGRRVTGGAFMSVPNIDYIVEHWGRAKYQDPARYGDLEDSAHWLYAGRWADQGYPQAIATTPVWDASLVRFSPDGTFLLLLEFLAEPQTYLWREDIRTGQRRVVTAIPQGATVGDISFTGDGKWAIVGGGEHLYLVNTDSGVQTKVQGLRAACWHPGLDASTLLAAVESASGSTIGTYSLATEEWQSLCDVPVNVLGLDVSASGAVAAVVSNPDTGVHNVAVLDLSTGSIEPCRPTRFTCGVPRRTQRPRWIDRPGVVSSPTQLSDGWRSALQPQVQVTRTPDWQQKMITEWRDRIARRVTSLEADPQRLQLASQLMALCFEVTTLSPTYPSAEGGSIVQRIKTIAQRPFIDDELRLILVKVAVDLDSSMRSAAQS